MLTKNCALCGKEFEKPVWVSLKNWNEIRKYCSRECLDNSKLGNTYRRGKPHNNIWNKGKKGLQVAWNKGNGEYAKKLGFGKWMKGRHLETYKHWKGDKAGYGSKHEWVVRWKGNPDTCENCGKKGTGHSMHWANIDHKYKRKLSDWKRLCAKCHKAHDKFI
jgi:hypothetical protein